MTTTSALPLSNDDEAVINRSLPASSTQSITTPASQVDEVYDIQRTAAQVVAGRYVKIALQFPDALLVDAPTVVARLKTCISNIPLPLDNQEDKEGKSEANGEGVREGAFYVLGDTSYGSCCVDEVAAEHVAADVLLHYGRSCLSVTRALPVIYVWGHFPITVAPLLDGVQRLVTDRETPLLLVSDTCYVHAQAQIEEGLIGMGFTNVTATSLIDPNERHKDVGTAVAGIGSLNGRSYTLHESTKLSNVVLIYIGPPSPTLTNILLTHSSLVAAIYTYDPISSRLSSETTQNTQLRRRYAVVQKARDAEVVGIVVGTLGVDRYLEIILHLRSLVQSAKKKSYVFAMGKLNPAKLANFAEIDVFVLVACGENSLVESRDFFKPIVTPFELSLALGTGAHDAVPWTGEWITNFDRVMMMSNQHEPAQDTDRDEDAPHFSLVTGRYSSSNPARQIMQTANDEDYAVSKRSTDTALAQAGNLFSPSAQRLAKRQWRGLGTDHDPQDEEQEKDEGVAMTEGRSGIARNYAG